MKKTFFILMSICLTLSFASCGEVAESVETESDDIKYEQSYADENNDWKRSLLSKAGLDNVEEPEGEKVFTTDENGNVTFTVAPATKETLSTMALNVYSELGNITDKINPVIMEDALDSETHFKVEYTLGSKKISLELTLNESVLTGQIIYS